MKDYYVVLAKQKAPYILGIFLDYEEAKVFRDKYNSENELESESKEIETSDLRYEPIIQFSRIGTWHDPAFIVKIKRELGKYLYILTYVEDGEGESYHLSVSIYADSCLDLINHTFSDILECEHNLEDECPICEEDSNRCLSNTWDELYKTGESYPEGSTYCLEFYLCKFNIETQQTEKINDLTSELKKFI